MSSTSPGRRLSGLTIAAIAAASALIGLGAGIFLIKGAGPGSGAPAAEDRQARASEDGAPPAPAVTLARVARQPVNQTLTAIGTGRAVQSLTLNADVAGVIKEIPVESGQTVEAGAPLVVIDQREQEIAVARARADYNIAKTNAQRFKSLVADEAASALEYEAAQNDMSAATAQLQQAEFNLAQRTIRAPFDGVVGLMQLDIGDYLTVGGRVTTIDDVSSLLVDFVVPESGSSALKTGLTVTAVAQTSASQKYTGRIRAIDSRINPVSRTRRVEAIIANDDYALIPGSTFSISFAAPGKTAAVVPGLAVQWDRAGAYVWKVGEDGAAERVPVAILQRNPYEVIVDAALTTRDYVVAEGADAVREGARLAEHGGGEAPAAFQ